MTEEKLKPCPFCGSASVSAWQLSDIPPYPEIPMNWVAGCVTCDIAIGNFNSETEAADAWNRRPAPTPTEAETARLRRALIRLYLDEQLSEGQLSMVLAVDRLEARTMVETFKRTALAAPSPEMPRPESWSIGPDWGEWRVVARDSEEESDLEAPIVTCETCGGETGDGWSTCTCDDDPDWDDPYSDEVK